jgi:hypothetical protein
MKTETGTGQVAAPVAAPAPTPPPAPLFTVASAGLALPKIIPAGNNTAPGTYNFTVTLYLDGVAVFSANGGPSPSPSPIVRVKAGSVFSYRLTAPPSMNLGAWSFDFELPFVETTDIAT